MQLVGRILKGFPEAIASVFPQTRVQLCIVHQIRSSMKYVPDKEKKAVMQDLKPVYKAVNAEQGYERLLEFEEKWVYILDYTEPPILD